MSSRYDVNFVIRLDLSNAYTGDEKYTNLWFESTKAYLNKKFAVDGVIFLKEALNIFGFSTKEIDHEILSRRWIYKDKRSKIRVRLGCMKINECCIPTIEFTTKVC